jgi:CubicO group peptidase (beta-lactamase class C family)
MSPCKKWRLIPFLFAASLVLLTSCGGESESKAPGEGQPPQQARAAVWPGDDWEVSTPEGEGMDAMRLEDVASYCEVHKCGAVVVTRHGRIVWERYWGGWDENSTDNSWSMAKSMTDAIVGIAISEGKIKSVDESAADFIPEWRGTRKEEITLRNLLSMTSGLLWNEDYYEESDMINMITSYDQTGYAISQLLPDSNRQRCHGGKEECHTPTLFLERAGRALRLPTTWRAGATRAASSSPIAIWRLLDEPQSVSTRWSVRAQSSQHRWM